jgi:hypothetical protein
MHNHHQQQHFKLNNIISKLAVIVLSIVLLTGISLVPALQVEVYGQVQQQLQPKQQNQVGLNQVIKQIAQQVANANPGTNATHVHQILVQLAKQTAQTASQEQAIKEIRQIASQVATYPFGTVSLSLAQFAKQVASGSSSVMQVAQQIIQEKSSTGKDVSGSVITKAVQTATGATSNNINQVIRQAAQTLANAAGVPVQYVEAVIIQIALQVSQAQGKAISGQTIFEIANQIAQNPNGVLAQAIIQLAKQYVADNGRTSQTVQIINNVIKTGGSSSKTIVKVIERDGGGNNTIPGPSTCTPGQYYDSLQKKCVTPPVPDRGCIGFQSLKYNTIEKRWECVGQINPTPQPEPPVVNETNDDEEEIPIIGPVLGEEEEPAPECTDPETGVPILCNILGEEAEEEEEGVEDDAEEEVEEEEEEDVEEEESDEEESENESESEESSSDDEEESNSSEDESSADDEEE